MSDAAIFDELAISKVVIDWGFARDQGDWEGLKACFHEDATVEIMWIAGPAHEFADSLKNRPPQKPGESTKHQVGTPITDLERMLLNPKAHRNPRVPLLFVIMNHSPSACWRVALL